MDRDLWLFKKFKFHFFLFYLFGLTINPCNSLRIKSKCVRTLLNFLPPTITIILAVIIGILIANDLAQSKLSSFSILQFGVNICHSIHPILWSCVTLFSSQSQTDLLKSIFDCYDCIEHSLHNKISFGNIQKRVNIKSLFMILFFAIEWILMFSALISSRRYLVAYVLILVIWRVTITLKLLFYIELINWFQSSLCLGVEEMKSESCVFFEIDARKMKVMRVLRNLKRVHFKLWKISSEFNHCYGWVLTNLFLGYFLLFTYFGFFIYVNIDKVKIRKYK